VSASQEAKISALNVTYMAQRNVSREFVSKQEVTQRRRGKFLGGSEYV
jgi:hypothetical protein